MDRLEPGIYFGWCKLLDLDSNQNLPKDNSWAKDFTFSQKEFQVLPMVMSIGWNPFYKNEKKAAEIHIIHQFDETFYGAGIEFIVAGYLRPELDYTTKGTS